MGVWGHGAFENDTALDWAMDLAASEDPLPELRLRLQASEAAPLDVETADIACAAVAFLACSLNRSYQTLPDELLPWAALLPAEALRELLPAAERALARVTAQDSESREMWKDAGDYEYSAWIRAMQRTARELKRARESA